MTPSVWRAARVCTWLLCASLLCTGCWDVHEIDDLAIVSVAGWDQAGQQVTTTLQIARPSALGSTSGGGSSSDTGTTKTFVLEQGTGTDPVDALEQVRQKLSRTMIMSHREVLVLGESYARQQGISTLMDEVIRNPESRLRTDILVAYHGQAADVLKLPYALNRLPASAVRGMEDTGTIPRIDAREWVKDLTAERDPYAVGIEPVRTLSDEEPYSFRFDHVAVFHNDRLVGWLEHQQVDGFLWIKGGMKRMNASVYLPQQRGYVGLKLLDLNAKVNATLVKGQPAISISIQAMDDLTENGTKLDFDDPSAVSQVRHLAERRIRRDVQSAVDVLQHQYHADICGFGEKLYEKYPNRYRTEWKPRWDEVYSHLPVSVKVDVQVQRSGLTVQSLK